jgi:ferredoxin
MSDDLVAIDSTRCQGHGRCYELAPDVFTDDERGYGSVRTPTFAADQRGAVEAAVHACPERAIQLSSQAAAPAQDSVSPG